MKYTEESNALVLSNAVPLTDEEGKSQEKEQVFDFTVSIDVTGDFSVAYEVVAEKEADSTLEDQYIKLYLERFNDGKNYEEVMAPTIYTPITEATSFGAPAGSMILETGVVTETTKYYYRLRMWVDGSYERENESRTYAVKVNVYGTTEKNTLDEKGPVCRLEPSGEVNVGKETEVKLICTDATTGLVEKHLTIEDFINSNEEVGIITGISDPVKTANGYEYTLTIRGNKVGTTTISLKEGVLEDSLGNQNTMIPNELNIKGLTYTVHYDKKDHIKTISKEMDSCTTIEDQVTCQVMLPEITTESGYQEDGWYLEDTLIGKGNTSYTIGSDITLSAKAKLNSYTVTYDYASNGGSSSSKTTDIVNYQAEIDLTPTAEKAGYTFVGWNTNQDAHEGLKSLTMKDQDVTLYAIYQKEVEATFYYYDGTHQASTSTTCSFYNLEESCNYTVPEVVTSSVGINESTYKGVSTSPSSEEITTTVNSLTTSYYAVYKGDWTVQYEIGKNVESIGGTKDSCEMSMTSDGESYTGSSCTIQTLPTITNIEGYDNENDISVWSTESGATEGSEPGNSYTLTGNITLYANGVDKTRPTVEMKKYTEDELKALTNWSQNKEIEISIKDTGSGLSVGKDGTPTTIWYGWSKNTINPPSTWTEQLEFNNEKGAKEIKFTAKCSTGRDDAGNDICDLTGEYYLWWANPIIYDVADNRVTSEYNDGAYGIFADTVFKFDNTAPTITKTGSSQLAAWDQTKYATITLKDEESGLGDNISIQYGWSTDSNNPPTTWKTTDVNYAVGNSKEATFKATATSGSGGDNLTGKFYLWLKIENYQDTLGNKFASDTKYIDGPFWIDNTAPSCTTTTWNGESTTWTKDTRIITAGCSDSHSGCVANYDSDGETRLDQKTYWAPLSRSDTDVGSTSAKTKNITLKIKDAAGNTKSCTKTVNVYFENKKDLTAPTIAGSYTAMDLGSHNGWYTPLGVPVGAIIYVTNPTAISSYSKVVHYEYCTSSSNDSCENSVWSQIPSARSNIELFYCGDANLNNGPTSVDIAWYAAHPENATGLSNPSFQEHIGLDPPSGRPSKILFGHACPLGINEGRSVLPPSNWVRDAMFFAPSTNYIFFRAVTQAGNQIVSNYQRHMANF